MPELLAPATHGPGETFSIRFDGEPIDVRRGQTIAAALISAGHRSWRTTRLTGEARGLFCGIGVCYDCLVTVNDVSSVRACLAAAMPGDVVRTERGAPHAELAV
jgi:aerobic-type carbon monoxide dehydrogenase small subunit (CoxS/CutS family)